MEMHDGLKGIPSEDEIYLKRIELSIMVNVTAMQG